MEMNGSILTIWRTSNLVNGFRSAHGLYLYLHLHSIWRLDGSARYGGYTPTYISYFFLPS